MIYKVYYIFSFATNIITKIKIHTNFELNNNEQDDFKFIKRKRKYFYFLSNSVITTYY